LPGLGFDIGFGWVDISLMWLYLGVYDVAVFGCF